MPPTPPASLDAHAAYPEVAVLRPALRDHDWAALRALFAGADPATATHLADVAANWGGLDSFLRLRLRDDPEDHLAQTLLGATLLASGWRIRTAARAAWVGAERFARFQDHLRRAEQILIDVTARRPDDAAAWTQRITTARGLELGQAETRRRYDRLARHHAHHLPAQLSPLQQLCPKHLALAPLGPLDHAANGTTEALFTSFVVRGGPAEVNTFLATVCRHRP